MPSWVTHLATANRISDKLNISDKNSFLLGNLVPDMLNNYIIKQTSSHVEYQISHFTDETNINGIIHDFPNCNRFYEKYKDKMDNPVVCGYFVHLLTDYFWNNLSYNNYFVGVHDDLVKLKLIDGSIQEYEYDVAIKIKQRDFKIFTQYLKENYEIGNIFYNDEILNYGKYILEVPFQKEDIQKVINVIEEYFKEKIELSEMNYKLFTQDLLNKYFDESIDFIIDKLKKKGE